MNKILVPTDFSELSHHAFEVAAAIAKKTQAEIHLVHVLENIGEPDVRTPMPGEPDSGPGEGMEVLLMRKLTERSEKKMHKMKKEHEELNISEHISVVDDIYEGVENYADEHNIDMIVMGSTGASGFQEITVGSNAERVVRHSKQPVLVVKNKIENFDIKNIVFATNAEENAQRLTQTLKNFQETFGAKLHLVNINTPLNFYTTRSLTKMLEDFAKEHQLSNYTLNVYNDRTEEDGIIYFADDVDADLIAMGTHGRTGLAHFFSGSIAEDVVNHSYRPILTFKLR